MSQPSVFVIGRNGLLAHSNDIREMATRLNKLQRHAYREVSADPITATTFHVHGAIGAYAPNMSSRMRVASHWDVVDQAVGPVTIVNWSATDDDGPEAAYQALVRKVADSGSVRSDRTGTGTLSVFGNFLEFNLADGRLPLMTTRFISWRIALHELIWFVHGKTDVRELHANNVRIWDANTSEAFLRARGLEWREYDAGPIYGFQLRHFGAPYRGCDVPVGSDGVDQLRRLVDAIRKDPSSRRHVVSMWNPVQLDEMCLPPCHMGFQVYVTDDGRLDLMFAMRSTDIGAGAPYNIVSYAMLAHILAAMTSLRPGRLLMSIGDAHIYSNHTEAMRELLKRPPLPSPTFVVSPSVATKTFDEIQAADFRVVGHLSHPPLKVAMNA